MVRKSFLLFNLPQNLNERKYKLYTIWFNEREKKKVETQGHLDHFHNDIYGIKNCQEGARRVCHVCEVKPTDSKYRHVSIYDNLTKQALIYFAIFLLFFFHTN